MLIKLLANTPDAEKICALAGRLCYTNLSLEKLSEKLTDNAIEDILNKIISSGHTSVLEHASFTIGVEGVSRTLLAQLTRHRIASFSVQSQRYVKFKDKLTFVTPHLIKNNKELFEKYIDIIEKNKIFYDELLAAGIPSEDARYVLPQAADTKIILTMNARELRHFFALRCCNRAQWEIREMACQMLNIVKKAAPLLFKTAGPACVDGSCVEMNPCGKPWNTVQK